MISLYWAAGGTIGISTLAQTIQDRTREQDTGFLVLTAVTGVMKIGAGLVALATIQHWGHRIHRRLLLVLVWGLGMGFTLYGVANFIDKVLMATGVRSVPGAVGAVLDARWRALSADGVGVSEDWQTRTRCQNGIGLVNQVGFDGVWASDAYVNLRTRVHASSSHGG